MRHSTKERTRMLGRGLIPAMALLVLICCMVVPGGAVRADDGGVSAIEPVGSAAEPADTAIDSAPAIADAQDDDNPDDPQAQQYETYGDWTYRYLNNNAYITKYAKKGQVADVTIPQTLNGRTVVALEGRVFAGDTVIQSIHVPPGIRSIDVECFKGCTSLTTVEIADDDSLATIGYSCFEGCTALSSITIPSSVVCIDDNTFKGCTSLATVSFVEPSLVTNRLMYIGKNAFEGCTALTAIEIPKGVHEIRNEAFKGCINLASLTFVDGCELTKIFAGAFYDCPLCADLLFPDDMAYVGSSAFQNCTNIRTVGFVSNPTVDGQTNVFAGCTNLYQIYVPNSVNSKWFNTVGLDQESYSHVKSDYDSASKKIRVIQICAGQHSSSKIEIPVGIGSYTFATLAQWCSSGGQTIHTVTFAAGSQLTTIEEKAFWNSDLVSITIPASVSKIGEQAFYGNYHLENVTFETKDGVSSLGEIPTECFRNCTSLKHIELPEGVWHVKTCAFFNCTSLETAYFPNSVRDFDRYVIHCDDDKLTDGVMANLKCIRMPDSDVPIVLPATDEMFYTQWPINKSEFSIKVAYGSWFEAVWMPAHMEGSGSYRLPVSVREYEKIDINDESVEMQVASDNPLYTGSVRVPDTVSVMRYFRNKPLTAGFSIAAHTECINVGDQQCSATDTLGRFEGARVLDFRIEPVSITYATMHTDEPFTFDGERWYPKATFSAWNGTTWVALVEGTDYKTLTNASYSDNMNAGKAHVTVEGQGNYTGTATFDFTIAPASLKGAEIEVETQWYTGEPVKPIPTKATIPNRDPNKRSPIYYHHGKIHDYDLFYNNSTKIGKHAQIILEPANGSSLADNKTFEFTIKGNLEDCIVATIPDQAYTSHEIKPKLEVHLFDLVLEEGRDYTVSYEDNTEVGTAKATISAKSDDFANTKTVEFKIVPRPVIVTPNFAQKTYGEVDPPLSAQVDGLIEGTSVAYTLSRAPGENVGTYSITATGKQDQGNYTVTFKKNTFMINAANIKLANVSAIGDVVYNGSAQEPAPTVTYNNAVLVKDKDYELWYRNNKDVGTATMYIGGIGNFQGTDSRTFNVLRKPVTVAANKDAKKTFGEADPAFVAEVDGVVDGYKLAYGFTRVAGEDAGRYPITVSGEELQGNYTVSYSSSAALVIAPAAIGTARIDPVLNHVYTGSPITPRPRITFRGVPLVEGVDYTLSYSGNVNVGTARITIAGMGNFTGTATVDFKITPKQVTVTPNSFTKVFGDADPVLTAKVDGVADGAKILYSLSRASGEDVGTYAIVASGAASQGNYTVSFGKGALVVEEAPITRVSVAAIDDVVYDGEAYEPKPTLRFGDAVLTEGKDYALSYEDNTNVGTAKVRVAGKGNFKGSTSASFRILPHDISTGACTIAVGYRMYTGDEVKPVPAYVEVPGRGGKALRLELGRDYTVVGYRDNVNIGLAHLTIKGCGNYEGSREGDFNILSGENLRLGSVDEIPDQVYAAGPIEPPMIVTLPDVDLIVLRDVNYEAYYTSNVDVGVATVRLEGINDVTGELTTTFRIVPKEATVVANRDAKKTFGEADPLFSAEVDGVIDDFQLVYGISRAAGEDVGRYPLTVSGEEFQGNYHVSYASDATLTIVPAAMGTADVEPVLNHVHTGAPITPKPQVSFKGVPLVEGVDYTVTYANNVDMGTAHIIIAGMGNFTSTTVVDFEITQAVYEVKSAPASPYLLGSSASLEFAFSRPDDDGITFDHFVGVEVDGRTLEASEYEAKRGSVVITLSPAYLDTLSVGKHQLTAVFDDGLQVAEFEVAKKEKPNPPKPDPDPKPTPSPTPSRKSGEQNADRTGKTSLAKTADVSGEPAEVALLCAIVGLALLGWTVVHEKA